MTEILLCRRYWSFNGETHTHIDTVDAEFKTQGLVLYQKGIFPECITINERGQKILYEELKKRFEK